VVDAFVEGEIRAAIHARPRKLGLNFFGGEPLLEQSRVVELTNLAKRLAQECGVSLDIGITTNGTLLTRLFLEWCQHEGVRIMLSLDSPPEIHDQYRAGGKPTNSFEEIRNRIRGFESDLTVVMTVTRQMSSFRNALERLFAIGFGKVCFNFVHSRDKELALQSDDITRLVGEWEQEEAWFSRHAAQIGNLCEMHEMIRCRTPKTRPCSAGGASFAIGPDAKRYFCHGCVGDPDLELVSGRSVFSGKGGLKDVEGLESVECRKCWARGLCGGDCWLVRRGYSAEERQGRCDLIRGFTQLALSTFVMDAGSKNNNG